MDEWLLVGSPSFLEMPSFSSQLGRKGGASAHRDLIQNHCNEQIFQLSVIPIPCVATRFGNLIKTLRMGTVSTDGCNGGNRQIPDSLLA